ETFPPGSTFKILTAAAALENGVVTDVDAASDTVSPYPLPLSSNKISSEAGDAVCNKASMKTAMQHSCNNVFLDAASKVGADRMRGTAEKFGFNRPARQEDHREGHRPPHGSHQRLGHQQGDEGGRPLTSAVRSEGPGASPVEVCPALLRTGMVRLLLRDCLMQA
ncbi:penicillin-binding transpeptidase domain-containing protein, partial [Streptomyces atratus]|uniref:penicillin-binding transpeptidase domain-containing protein n=1 Tax=Streptomyces atratus TaxID=1893 RepID=UPI003F53EA58